MLLFSLFFLLLSNSLSFRRDILIYYSRIGIVIQLYCIYFCYNSFFWFYLNQNVGIFDCIFNISSISLVFYILTLLVLIFPGFFYKKILEIYFSPTFFLGIFCLHILYFTNLLVQVIVTSLIMLQIYIILLTGIFILYYVIPYIFQKLRNIFSKYPGLFKVIICVSILLLLFLLGLLLLGLLNFVFLEIYVKRLLQILPIIVQLIISVIFMYSMYNTYKLEFLLYIKIYFKYILYFFIFILGILLCICFVLSYVDILILETFSKEQFSKENLYFLANSPLDFNKIIDWPALFIQEDLNFQKEYTQFKSNVYRVRHILDSYFSHIEYSQSEKRYYPRLKPVSGPMIEDEITGELASLRKKINHAVDPLLNKLNTVKYIDLKLHGTLGKTPYNYDLLDSDIRPFKNANRMYLLDPNKVRNVP